MRPSTVDGRRGQLLLLGVHRSAAGVLTLIALLISKETRAIGMQQSRSIRQALTR